MDEIWANGRLARLSDASRRGALRLLGAGGIAALLDPWGETAAKKKGAKKGKQKNKKKPPKPVLTFALERSEAAADDNCLEGARGTVKIFELGFAERMEISVAGLPANTEFDVFVIQAPDAPFGLSWYQGDMTTGGDGRVTKSFVGRFNEETFIVAPGVAGAPVVHAGEDDNNNNGVQDPVHTAHVGIWFNSPDDAEAAGCGADVTPFNGDHTAGIQALSSRGFADNEGPLLGVAS